MSNKTLFVNAYKHLVAICSFGLQTGIPVDLILNAISSTNVANGFEKDYDKYFHGKNYNSICNGYKSPYLLNMIYPTYICFFSLRALSLFHFKVTSWWRHQMEKKFRVTGHLCREFTGHRWIPRTKASDAFSLIFA